MQSTIIFITWSLQPSSMSDTTLENDICGIEVDGWACVRVCVTVR